MRATHNSNFLVFIFIFAFHIPKFNITFSSEVLASSDKRPYRNLTLHSVLARTFAFEKTRYSSLNDKLASPSPIMGIRIWRIGNVRGLGPTLGKVHAFQGKCCFDAFWLKRWIEYKKPLLCTIWKTWSNYFYFVASDCSALLRYCWLIAVMVLDESDKLREYLITLAFNTLMAQELFFYAMSTVRSYIPAFEVPFSQIRNGAMFALSQTEVFSVTPFKIDGNKNLNRSID